MLTWFQELLTALQSMGIWGPLLFIPIYILANLLFVPNPILFFAAGALFGIPLGFASASFASLLSAVVGFILGRRFSRGWVLKKVNAHPKVKAMDDAVTERGWKMVSLIRFTSILPFTVTNYGLGLSNIPLLHYTIATGVCMAPGILLYTALGSFAGNVALAGQTQRTPAEWAFLGISFLVTVGVGIYATNVVRKVIKDS